MNQTKTSMLIVDDEIYIQEILKSTMEDVGFECTTVGTAEAAEAELASRNYALVFCDVIMPGKSGIELLRTIREKYPQIIVVMITAVDTASSAMETIRLGAYDYIVKPFNLELVTNTAHRAMEKLRLEAANREYQAYLQQVADDRAAETRRLFYSMTQVLIGLLELKEPFKAGYLKRIAEMSRYVARELKMTEDGVRKVYLAALLHDIGMISVEDMLLTKRGALTEQEASQIHDHTSVAESVLKPILGDDEVLKYIRHHHERYDGTGYPDSLRGNIIPLGARIISVVAAFVAMQWNRPYRKALSSEEAIAELLRCSHSQFDHNVVTVFASLYDRVFRSMDNSLMGLP
jgi:putative two-component system response regulator